MKLIRNGIFLSAIFVVICVSSSRSAFAVKDQALDKRTKKIEDVLKNYYFVADFEQKPAERDVSDRLFWKYPFKLPDIEFPIEFDFEDIEREFPKTVGEGRATEHMALGRRHFLDGEFEKAKDSWLAARSRYGKEFPHHRRNDYFIAYAFVQLAKQELALNNNDYKNVNVRSHLDNAATFFAWAYNAKKDIPDEVVDRNSPKSYYNMAAIYWRYQRYAGAYGAAEKGLNFLRMSGRTKYRPQFQRITAEAFIKNRTYLDAVQVLDVAVRQDPDPEQVAAIFARVGDIYFDLNNYELAADAYRNGSAIDEELLQISPTQLILRGESQFWMGEFDEAQKLMDFGIRGSSYRTVVAPLPFDIQAYAALRIADAYLAKKDFEKARLEYYKVAHNYRGTEASRIALVRDACLDLPAFSGKNLGHARNDLEKAKESLLPMQAQELAWACQVGSYAERERTPEMVERVRIFSGLYPQSRFLRDLVEPVRETQAKKIQDYFAANDKYKAVNFYETNKDLLFATTSNPLKKQLFAAYVDIFQPEKAAIYWEVAEKAATSDRDYIRMAVESVEMASKTGDNLWGSRSQKLAVDLRERAWKLAPEAGANRQISRIMAVEEGRAHLPWIANLAATWAKVDEKYMCNLKFPAMSKMLQNDTVDLQAMDQRIGAVIDNHMPNMLKTDEACALSVLDLEIKINDAQLATLGDRYLARDNWPLIGSYANAFWALSEKIEKNGSKDTAKKMWERLVEKAPANSSVRRFAMARLDNKKTEFESLWDN